MPRALREHWLPWLVWNYRVDGIPIYHLVIASTDDHSVHVCKSTYTDAACTHPVSNCWDVLENNCVYPNNIELSWAREPAVAGECFNKTVVRDKILQRETFDVHLDWCIPNTNNGDVSDSNGMVSSSNNIFSRQETTTTTTDSQQDQSDSQYILPLVVNRFYPDETSCQDGTNEIDVTALPPAKTRSSYLVHEDLCVAEHPFTSGPHQSLQLYCSRANSFENNSRVRIVKAPVTSRWRAIVSGIWIWMAKPSCDILASMVGSPCIIARMSHQWHPIDTCGCQCHLQRLLAGHL